MPELNGVHCLPVLFSAAECQPFWRASPFCPSAPSTLSKREGKEKGRTSFEQALHRNLISPKEAGKPVFEASKVRLHSSFMVLVLYMHH